MAIKPFNSVNGFSVGETPTPVILANGDITTGNATLTGNLAANNVLTDNLRYANGVPWDFQQAAGTGNYQIQYNLDNDFGASANFTFNPTTSLLTVTGNANVTNTLFAGNISVPTGNINANRIDANVYGNVYANTILSGSNTGVTFNDAGVLTVANTFTFDKTTNLVSITGNLSSGNANLGNLAVANYFTGVFTTGASSQPNITSVGTLTGLSISGTGSITGANLVSANFFTGTLTTPIQPNITQVGTLGNLNVQGNIAAGNISGANLISANYFIGNFWGAANTASTVTSSAQPNITSVGTLSNLAIADTGSVTGANLISANYVTGTLTTAAQPNITSVGTLDNLNVVGGGAISGANLVSANYIAGTLLTASQPNITTVGTLTSTTFANNANITMSGTLSQLSGANLLSANYITGTLTTGAQPNITSLGTLSSLYVTGNANVDGSVNAGNLSVANRVITSLVPATNNTQDLGGSGNVWANVWLTNIKIGTTYITSTGNVVNLDNANIANNTSTDSLTVRNDGAVQGNLTVTGNLTVAGNTTYINVSSLSISDPLIEMGGTTNGGNATTYDGKDRGMILHNFKADDSGPINQAFIWKTANGEFQAISNVASIVNEDVTAATFGNIRLGAVIGNLQGTVLQASQTNITQVGTLGNLTISGNLLVQTAANIVSLKAGPLTFPSADGAVGQVLATHGNGELYFTTVSTSALANGTSNVVVYPSGNVTISSAGNANVLVVTGTGVNVAGYLNVTGAGTFGGNVTVGNLLIGNSSIRSVTVTTSSTSSNQTIATFSLTGVRGAIFDVKGEDSTGGKFSIATVSAVHDSTGNVDYSVYGTVLVGGYTGSLAVNIISGNMYLGVTPASSNATVWTTQFRTI